MSSPLTPIKATSAEPTFPPKVPPLRWHERARCTLRWRWKTATLIAAAVTVASVAVPSRYQISKGFEAKATLKVTPRTSVFPDNACQPSPDNGR